MYLVQAINRDMLVLIWLYISVYIHVGRGQSHLQTKIQDAGLSQVIALILTVVFGLIIISYISSCIQK